MSKYIALLLLLIPCTVSDLKRMEIPLLPVFIICPAAAVVELIFFGLQPVDALFGALAGSLFILLALAARKNFGMGDGILITGIGLFCGARLLLPFLLIAFLLAAFLGGSLLLLRRGSVRQRIPFVPFMLLSAIVCFLLKLIGPEG